LLAGEFPEVLMPRVANILGEMGKLA